MQTIGVNIVPGNFPQFVRYSQNDIGREFKINVVDFDIPSGATVECVATKPSGLGFTVSGTVTDNTVSFITTAIMTDEWGKFPAELRISSGGEVLGTANFMFIGERNPHPEGTTDGQQGTIIPELTLLVNEIRESNARVAEMTASAHTSDVPTAEYDAETNNLEFGIPSIPEEEFLKAFVTDSASGSIASITDGGDGLPVKSLNVSIVPKQSGSGDPSPSNVRPITGWDEVEVLRTGKNLGRISQQIIDNGRTTNGITFQATSPTSVKITGTATGTVYMTAGYPVNSLYLRLLKAGTYTFSNNVRASGINGAYVTGYPVSGGASRNLCNNIHEGQTETFTIAEDFYSNIQMIIASGYTANDEVWFQLEEGTSATAYEPYQGESYPISLGQTVYGGTLDVVSGKLVIDRAFQQVAPTNTMRMAGDICQVNYSPASDNAWQNLICSHFPAKSIWSGTTNEGIGCWSGQFYFRWLAIGTTIEAWRQFFTDNNVQFTYTLATPIEVNLTPTQVNTLLGSNNIYSSCGDVEVEYRADTKLYIDKLLGNTRTLSMAMAPAPEETTTEEEPAEEEQR